MKPKFHTACYEKGEDTKADKIVASGITGVCTWTLAGTALNYTLIISGNGAMEDYDDISIPWDLYHDDIKTLVIQAGVTTIGRYAFSNCNSLTSITNLNPTSQSINGSVFWGVNMDACTLRVPAGAVNAYKGANVWKEFGNIVSI